MVEIKRNKISLDDYDYKSDIANRLLMAQFTTLDLLILEEILYSPLKISLRKLARTLYVDEMKVLVILDKFSTRGLLKVHDDEIIIDKEMRKYYEAQVPKFDEDFIPGMDSLQVILKKVPIQVLPNWYSISRSSNNIFGSVVEKYLLTPQIFQRYMNDIQLADPVLVEMVKTVYEAPDFKIFGSALMDKFDLSRERFEENMLYLEFNFLCCLSYEKVGDEWREIVTPFQEWREYLRFLKNTETAALPENAQIARHQTSNFDYIEALSSLLMQMKNGALPPDELSPLVHKLRLFKFVDIVGGKPTILEAGNDWLNMTLENRALFLYRQPLNCISLENFSPHLSSERSLREAEKCITRVLHKGWVYFDDFIKGVIVHLSENSIITLKKCGKIWKYTLPVYDEEEKKLIKTTLFDWLPKVGFVLTGTHEGRDCFCVTPLGASIFASR